MILVQIYSRPDCPLCEEAKTVLEKVQKDIPFQLTEINIELEQQAYDLYKEEIPVVFIQGQKAFKFKVHEKELRRRLERIQTLKR